MRDGHVHCWASIPTIGGSRSGGGRREAVVDGLALDGLPALARVLRRIATRYESRDDAALAVIGSLTEARSDAWTDLDLVIAARGSTVEQEHALVLQALSEAGQPLAHFTAEHLSIPELLVAMVELPEGPVKVDATARMHVPVPLSEGAVVLHDPNRLFVRGESPEQTAANLPRLDLADDRFVVWIWFAAARIVRGELFDATDALDLIRGAIVVPAMRARRELAAEGFRRLEELLPPAEIRRLAETYPTRQEPAELQRALERLIELYVDQLDEPGRPLATMLAELRRRGVTRAGAP